jgi:hypothetical protein
MKQITRSGTNATEDTTSSALLHRAVQSALVQEGPSDATEAMICYVPQLQGDDDRYPLSGRLAKASAAGGEAD